MPNRWRHQQRQQQQWDALVNGNQVWCILWIHASKIVRSFFFIQFYKITVKPITHFKTWPTINRKNCNFNAIFFLGWIFYELTLWSSEIDGGHWRVFFLIDLTTIYEILEQIFFIFEFFLHKHTRLSVVSYRNI